MYGNLETNLSMHVWLSSCPSTVSSSYPPNSGLNNHSKIELLFTIGNLLLFNEYSLKEIYYHDVKSQPKTKPLWNFMKLQFFPNWLTKISNELGLFAVILGQLMNTTLLISNLRQMRTYSNSITACNVGKEGIIKFVHMWRKYTVYHIRITDRITIDLFSAKCTAKWPSL